MNMNTEIRKLPVEHIQELTKILDSNTNWKKLMAVTPKTLERDTFKCDVTPNNPNKFNTNTIRNFETECNRTSKLCSKKLLHDWGNMGRVPPAIGHLLYLLKKAELYKEAEYVVTKILGIDPVTINDSQEPNKCSSQLPECNKPLTLPTNDSIIQTPFSFPHENVENQNSSEDQQCQPDFDKLLSCKLNKTNSDILPNLSVFNLDSNCFPRITSHQLEDLEETNLPLVSALQSTNINHISSSSNLQSSTSDTYKPTNLLLESQQECASPLPSLNLNTTLPHFSYSSIQLSTNNFDTKPYVDVNEPGRYLGSGAFGAVFLSFNLINNTHVAVKKLLLNEKDVSLDDTITIQFKTEIEVLSMYKHENLVSLMGYSCDGPTYCLVYEYVPRGVLKDRLKFEAADMLTWTERLHVALGTARAVSYLHTARETPLIHRDIKTANILLDANNKPKLCDFGIMKLISNQTDNLDTKVYGTSGYMAREAFSGDISVKLDTFSFGVVLLELITGLASVDEKRTFYSLVSYVNEICEDSIAPLVDNKAGSWKLDDVNYAEELYKIALLCLEVKKKRPVMTEVTKQLSNIIIEEI